MTGAEIVRRDAGGAVLLSVHGAFDGASAWALKIAIEETPSRDFIVDLTHAEEACEFAAGLLAAWVRRWGRLRRVSFRPGTAEHARLLAGHGLEIATDETAPRSALALAPPVDLAGTTSRVPA